MSAALALPFGSQAATATPAPKAPYREYGRLRDGEPLLRYARRERQPARPRNGLLLPVRHDHALRRPDVARIGRQRHRSSQGQPDDRRAVARRHLRLSPDRDERCGHDEGRRRNVHDQEMPFTFKLAATPHPAVFGSSISVRGVISGTGAANREVVLQSDPFPYLAGFKSTGRAELTSPTGRFSFSVADLKETPSSASPRWACRRPAATWCATRRGAREPAPGFAGRPGFVRLYGTVAPRRPARSSHSSCCNPDSRSAASAEPWSSAQPPARRASAMSCVSASGGLYRAFVLVNNGRQVPGHSQAILIG